MARKTNAQLQEEVSRLQGELEKLKQKPSQTNIKRLERRLAKARKRRDILHTKLLKCQEECSDLKSFSTASAKEMKRIKNEHFTILKEVSTLRKKLDQQEDVSKKLEAAEVALTAIQTFSECDEGFETLDHIQAFALGWWRLAK